MGRLLSEKGGLPSPHFAGPSQEEYVPERLRKDGEIPTWAEATRKFTDLIEYLEDEDVVAHRALDFPPFTEAWASAAWSELYRIDQKACQWAESTVLLIFSGSYWLDKESNVFLPPVTYLETLQASKQARQKALSRALKEIPQWQSIRCIGGEGYNGYPRIFVGLYLSNQIDKTVFEPVLESHINNCPIADPDAHSLDNIVSIRRSPDHKSRFIHGIGEKVPGLESGNGLLNEDWDRQKMGTVLHGGGWRPYSFGANL